MVILDAVAAVAPYAFVLPFLWIAAAYLVAAIRVRHTQPRRQILLIVAQAVWNALYWPLLLIFLSNSARNINETPWMLLWYGYFIGLPVLAIYGLRPTSKVVPRWRKIGFSRLDDFLLFRPLPIAHSSLDTPDAVDSKRWVSRSTVWLMLIVSICATGVSYLGNSLRPCEWLDLTTGRSGCLRTIAFDDGSVFSEIAFSPDGAVMAVADFQKPLRFYNVADGSLLRELPNQQTECGKSVSFSPDNRWVATISKDNLVSVSDIQTGSLIHALQSIAETRGVWFSPDGKYLAIGLARAGLQLWRTDNWTLHRVISAPVYSVSFSANSQWLAAETNDDRIGIWNLNDGAVYQTIYSPVYAMALSPDGKELTVSLPYALFKVWDVATGQLLRTIDAAPRGDFVYSSDGRYLLASESFMQFISYNYQVSLWRVTDGQRIASLPAYNNVGCAAFAAKSNMFAYSDWKSLKVFRLRQY